MGARYGRAYPPFRIWHNTFKPPPTFDVVNGSTNSVSPLTFSLSLTAADAVIVFVASNGNSGGSNPIVTGVTCNGVTVPNLANVAYGNSSSLGFLSAYGLTSASAGTVSITYSGTPITGCALGYKNVKTISTPTTAYGTSSPSQTLSLPGSSVGVQAFGIYGSPLSSPSGGTNRFNNAGSSSESALCASDTTATSTTFSATYSGYWAGMTIVLS